MALSSPPQAITRVHKSIHKNKTIFLNFYFREKVKNCCSNTFQTRKTNESGWLLMPVILALRRLIQEDSLLIKASQIYTVSFRLA